MSTLHAARAAPAAAQAPHASSAQQNGTRLLQPGQVISVNNHVVTIERYLSQGGFAHVYVVQSQNPINNTRQHVLKRIALSDESMLREVRKEVDVMKLLRSHPNIVNYIDATSQPLGNGTYEVFILMEFCPGGGIIDMMNRRLRERLTEAEILQIFVDVCEGVAYMHDFKPPLVHRDLKVENILQATATSFKLCDFGSATPASSRAPSTTHEIQVLEADLNRHTTLQYRAPEMIDLYLRRPIDEKSDVWALGVLLYKLCYYTTPFEEHGPLAILNVSYRTPPYPVYSSQMKALIASMLREHGTQRPSVFELLDVVHRMRGTKSLFRYSRPPPPSQSLRTPPAMTSVPSVVQTKPYVPVGAMEARKQVLDAIQPMRRGRPSQGVTLIPSPAPLSPVKSGPSRVTEALPRPKTEVAKFEDFSKSSGNDSSGWPTIGESPTPRGMSKSPGAQPSLYGFGDSFLHSSLPPSQNTRPPPLPSRTRPTAPARQHHRTGPAPKRDAFDGLGSTSSKPPAPTLGTLAISNLGTIGTGAGLRSPSAPYLTPDKDTATGNSVAQHGSSYTRSRIQSSSPSTELSAEERFPSIEAMNKQFDIPQYPSSSTTNYTPPVNNGASSLRSPISSTYADPPRVTSSITRSRPPTSGPTSNVTRGFASSQRAPSPNGPRPRSPQSTSFILQSRDAGSSTSKTSVPSRSETKSPTKFPTLIPQPSQKPLPRRSSITLQGLRTTNLSSESPTSASTESEPDDPGVRPGFRRKPTTSFKSQTRDWLTGSEPTSPNLQPQDRRSSRPSSPIKHEAPSIASLVPPPQTRIPRKSVPAASADIEPPPSNNSSLRVPNRENSAFSTESSGDDGPEDAVATTAPRLKEQRKSSPSSRLPTPQVNAPKAIGPPVRKSPAYDLVDVGDSSSSGSSIEKQTTGLRRSAAKRRSVQDLVDVSSFAPGRQTPSRHARRQTSVQDLVDITPGPTATSNLGPRITASPKPDNDTIDYDIETARSRFPTIKSSLSSLTLSSPAPSPAPRLQASSRPRPQSLFLPPLNDFLSPPTSDMASSPLSDDSLSPPLRPRTQRRSSISDMVSKYEALSSPHPHATGSLSRAPSGTYTKLVSAKFTGNASAPSSASSSKPPTTQPAPNIRPLRSPVTTTFRSQSPETTPRAQGHMRTGSKVPDLVSGLSNPNPPASNLARSSTPQFLSEPIPIRAQGHTRTGSKVPDTPFELLNANPPTNNPVRSSTPQYLSEPTSTRLNVVPPADFTGNPDVPVSPARRGRITPPHSPSPERPYQGVSKLIDQWQKKTEASGDALRVKPLGPSKAGLRH